ncbi:MAG: IS200/IS605 family transposase [Ignavibacteriae bacterium]|nr:IS200/IS605 family transposase [Ignavibacteriota bacterium]
MLHSYVRIYIHLIWTTKKREKLLNGDTRLLVKKHLVKNAQDKNINIDTLHVQPEHVHCLINLSSNQEVDDIVKLLKGESSHWINSENIITEKFGWQRGYGAFSISPSHLGAVRKYINNQDEHHKKKSFADEYKTILQKYGFSELETDESVDE